MLVSKALKLIFWCSTHG